MQAHDPAHPVAFRFAKPADAEAVRALIELAYRGPETAGRWSSESHLLRGPRTSLSEIEALIASPDACFVLAETGEAHLSGCALIQRRAEDGAAYFGMFAIDPDTHARGLGKAVLAACERFARELWRADAMILTVISLRTELIAWYERRGYALTGARFAFPFSETTGELRRDFDLIEMRKALA
ncbi:MAG: GNAT family N-acetyltransferase [Hyphomonadaceae bacterium]